MPVPLLAPKKFWRELTKFEERADVPSIDIVTSSLIRNALNAAVPVYSEIFDNLAEQAKPFIKKGKMPDKNFALNAGPIKRLLQNSMILANLWGRAQATLELERQGWKHRPFKFEGEEEVISTAAIAGATVSLKPVTPLRAMRSFAGKIPMTRARFDKLSDAAKAKAFTVAGIEKASIIAKHQGLVLAAIEEGLSFDEYLKRADELAAPFITGAHAETVMRTNLNGAYNSGRLDLFESAGDFVKAVQFSAILDDRTTDVCRKWDGTVIPMNSPMLNALTPPLHFNCRSTLISVTDTPDNASVKPTLQKDLPDVAPQKGFGRIPGKEPFGS